ncbi:hypothetical protein BC829DRAFT_393711 [Chytridium lagenaria]|nr:hypothetical protein BC829DRAFT_393711 [Chytridium lagenaria]
MDPKVMEDEHVSIARKRTLLGSMMMTGQGTALATIAGSSVGASLALFYAESSVAWGFGMGANWAVVSLPLFRHYVNGVREVPNLLVRDKDEMIASTLSGAVVGGGLGYIWRGPRSIPIGMLVYGSLATLLQFTATSLRHYRQSLSLTLETPSTSTPPSTLLSKWQTLPRFTSNPTHEPVGRFEIDPLGSLVGWITGKVVDRSGGGHELGAAAWWASPVLNAVDMEYRVRLNKKIGILERQVEKLRKEVAELEGEK